MGLFCHIDHRYTDRARDVEYEFMAGSFYAVPDDVAQYMATAHPDRFCLADNAENHHCGKKGIPVPVAAAGYPNKEMAEPPVDRELETRRRDMTKAVRSRRA